MMGGPQPQYTGTKALVGGLITGVGTVAADVASAADGGVSATEWLVALCAGVVVACAAAAGVYTAENKPK